MGQVNKGKQVVKQKTAKEVDVLSSVDGFHAVGGCPSLYLQVSNNAASWVLRVVVNGKRREMGLGSFPLRSLADARHLGMDLHRKVRDGIDPIEEKQKAKMASRVAKATGAVHRVDGGG